jgi:putative acetyltransferase
VAIIRELRAANALAVSLVAEVDGQVRGFLAASPVSIGAQPSNWHGLGPVAVDPPVQHRGLGSSLIVQCLAQLQRAGSAGCVVLGEPSFHRRFGFKATVGLIYPGPPAEYLLALPFGASMPQGEVQYHVAF